MTAEYTYTYETTDFRPAPPGWRVLYFTDDGHISTSLAGWLIQDETETGGSARRRTGYRQAAAAVMDDWSVEPVTDSRNFWCVLGPTDPDPTPEQDTEAREHWRKRLAYLKDRRAALKEGQTP